MNNGIHVKQKIYFVKTGKNHAFGTDFESRESMPEDQAVNLFDETWEKEIKARIDSASPVNVDEVEKLLNDNNRKYIRSESEHRSFKLAGSSWIAQITDGKNDQLWIVSNKAYDTRSITATFKTQQEKNYFDMLASKSGLEPQEYARRILTSHLSIYENGEE